jgi:hypothetical protein
VPREKYSGHNEGKTQWLGEYEQAPYAKANAEERDIEPQPPKHEYTEVEKWL